jgi:hypothetical protein
MVVLLRETEVSVFDVRDRSKVFNALTVTKLDVASCQRVGRSVPII